VLLMLGFCVLAPMADAVAKLIGAAVPLVLLVLTRFAIQAAMLAPIVLLAGPVTRLGRRALMLMVLRSLLHVAGVGAFFLALRFLPLADAIAIAYVMPFLLLLFGRFLLGEAVGGLRLAACIVGFAGTLMVIQPSFAEVGPPALLPLAVALLFALFMMVTRGLVRAIDPVALQALGGLMSCAILVPPLMLGAALGWPEFGLVRPDGPVLALIGLLGVLGTLAHLFLTWSLRFAPASTLAPMQYLEIPVATLVGFLVFGELPDGLAAAGIAVTIAAGLYIVVRERRLALARPLPSGGEM
jgi:drug/metabolite transporter (DMT)-like permease